MEEKSFMSFFRIWEITIFRKKTWKNKKNIRVLLEFGGINPAIKKKQYGWNTPKHILIFSIVC